MGFAVCIIKHLVCVQLIVSDSLQPPWIVACQAPLFMEFSRQEYWNGLPFPPPGYLPEPGIEPTSPASPALAGGFFSIDPLGKPIKNKYLKIPSQINKITRVLSSGPFQSS